MLLRSADATSQIELRPQGIASGAVAFALILSTPVLHATLDGVLFSRADLRRFCAAYRRLTRQESALPPLRSRDHLSAELRVRPMAPSDALVLSADLAWPRAEADADRASATFEITSDALDMFARELAGTLEQRFGGAGGADGSATSRR